MVDIRINGEDSSVNSNDTLKVSDLIELIKATIDPEHMITSIRIDGRELEDNDWTSPVSRYGTAIIEFETGTPEAFVNDRLDKASEVIRECYMEFRDARKTFQDGKMLQGNQYLVRAVNTLKSFFDWYSSLLDLCSQERRAELDISPQVADISDVCKRICQQQLYQSWWALGETIGKDLEPKLDSLEDHFRKFKLAA
jgi:hypothetical protein